MELELRQETLGGWQTLCHLPWEQEETAETIVPDACPDIWQVLSGEARILLQRKEAQEGRAECSGLLKTTILYQPEGEGGVQAMEATLPFSVSPEVKGLTRRCALHAQPRVLSVDVHVLNPRKVLLRVGYCLELSAYAPQNRSLAAWAEGEDLRQRTGTIETLVTEAVVEKAFTYSDTLVLPAGRPDVEEILAIRTDCCCQEAKVVGGKLVFKGEAVLRLLCRGEGGLIFPAEFRLPYSQLMDGGEGSEESVCTMDLFFGEVTVTPEEEDPRTIQVELSVLAQGVVRQRRQVPVLLDLYSTTHLLAVEETTAATLALLGRGEEQAAESGTLETAVPPTQLLDVSVRLGRRSQSTEGEDRLLTQETEVTLLYETQEGTASAAKTLTVSCRLPGESEGDCAFSAELLREPTVTLTGEGADVSLPLLFRWMTLAQGEASLVGSVEEGEPRDRGNGPSVVLRALRPGETLWDTAKRYGADSEAILTATGVSEEELTSGQMLLIPCKG
jgi:hypothetical protein